VHVFVERDQLIEIAVVLARQRRRQAFEQRITDSVQVRQRAGEGRQWKIPAIIVGNPHRVIERIGVGQDRRTVLELGFAEKMSLSDFPCLRRMI